MYTVQAVPFRRGLFIRCFLIEGKVWLLGDDCAYAMRFDEPYKLLLTICPSHAKLKDLVPDHRPYPADTVLIRKNELIILAQANPLGKNIKPVTEWLKAFPQLAKDAEEQGYEYPPDSEYLHVGELKEVLGISSSGDINRWLERERYQYMMGTTWYPTDMGRELCKEDSKAKRPAYSLRWNVETIKRRFNSSRRVGG